MKKLRCKHALSLLLMLSLILQIGVFSVVPASAAIAEPADDWNGAQWIWDTNTSLVNFTHDQWIFMRKTFELDEVPDSAVAKISIDSRYWLYINGEMVVREGQRKNGPTPTSVYYDEVDLTGHLKVGKNVIAVYGNYWGRRSNSVISYSNYSTGQAGFVFDLDIGGEHVVSDDTWKVKKDPAHTRTDTSRITYRLQECNAYHDAREEVPGWYLPDFDDTSWDNALVFGEAPCEPWGAMYSRGIPQWKDFGLKEYTNMDAFRGVSTGGNKLMEVPYNAQLTPYLKVIDTQGGRTIAITTDGSSAIGATYITKASPEPQEWESPVWTNGQYVTYNIPAGIEIISLMYRETGYDSEFAGYFVSDDAYMNRLWKMSQQTLYVTMRDNFMDCPDRERAQWWGDTTNEAAMTYYALDTASYDLYKTAVSTMIGWVLKDGIAESAQDVLRTVVPVDVYDGWTYELPMQQLAGVNGMWTHYMYTGSVNFLEEVYEPVKTYLGKWDMQPDGLVAHRLNSYIWDWPDWGDGSDMPALENAWYYLCLKVTAQMAQVLGKAEDMAWFEGRMASIADAYESNFWNGLSFKSSAVAQPDERANAVAVISGLATAEKYKSLIDNVFMTRMQCSPYMEKYVEDAMFMMGYADKAVERIKTRYNTMVSGTYSTLHEHFPASGSKNHAWSGGPLIAMSAYMAGIAPDAPGYTSYHILPNMSTLKEINVRVPSIKGNIDVTMERDPDAQTFTMDVVSPAGATARVGIPRFAGKNNRVSVGGVVLFEDGLPTANTVSGVAYLSNDEKYVYFSMTPGSASFLCDVKTAGSAAEYAVNVSANAGGSILLNGEPVTVPFSQNFEAGTVLTLTAAPDEGMVLTNWAGSIGSTDNTIAVIVDNTVNLSAQFDVKILFDTYIIDVAPSAGEDLTLAIGGSTYSLPAKIPVKEGETITITVNDSAKYAFAAWSGELYSAQKTLTLSPVGDMNLRLIGRYASFPSASGVAPNIALSAVGASSNSFENSATWRPINLYDGRAAGQNNGYSSLALYPAQDSLDISADPVWIDIDLGAPKSFNTIVIYPRQGAYYGSNAVCYPEKMQFQVSMDGVNYVDVGEPWIQATPPQQVPSAHALPITYEIGQQTARHFRIVVLVTGVMTNDSTRAARVQLTEIEIYDFDTGDYEEFTLTPTGAGSGSVKINGVLHGLSEPFTELYPVGTMLSVEPVADAGSRFTGFGNLITSTEKVLYITKNRGMYLDVNFEAATGEAGSIAIDAGSALIPSLADTLAVSATTTPSALGATGVVWSLENEDGSPSAIARLLYTDTLNPLVKPIQDGKAYLVARAVSGLPVQARQLIVIKDLSVLEAAMAAFGAKKQSDYTAASWGDAKTVYDAAEQVYGEDATTQEQVEAAAEALMVAIDALIEAELDFGAGQPAALTLKRGQIYQIKISSNNKDQILFFSANGNVSISDTGLVTGVKPGIAIITVVDTWSGQFFNIVINVTN